MSKLLSYAIKPKPWVATVAILFLGLIGVTAFKFVPDRTLALFYMYWSVLMLLVTYSFNLELNLSTVEEMAYMRYRVDGLCCTLSSFVMHMDKRCVIYSHYIIDQEQQSIQNLIFYSRWQ